MGFIAAKVVGWLIAPLNFLFLALLLAVAALWRGQHRACMWMLTIAVGTITCATLTPLPQLMLRPLEQAYSVPTELPKEIHGIVMVGGGQRVAYVEAYGTGDLGMDPAPSTFLRLARRYPNAKLVFAGGSGELKNRELSEADVFRQFARDFGLNTDRLIVEAQSRNTYENALFSKKLVQPAAGEKWILLTSAVHTPRTAACFLKLGWDVIAYPAGHYTLPGLFDYDPDALSQLKLLDIAIHEWSGLAAYKLLGRI